MLTEIANKGRSDSIWSPFPVADTVIFVHVQSEDIRPLSSRSTFFSRDMHMTETYLAELVQSAFSFLDGLHPVLSLGISAFQRVLEWR